MRIRVLLSLLAALPPACAAVPAVAQERHVVVIVIDGLRPDAIAAAPAPRLRALQERGAWTHAARTVGTPETLASLVTLVTGVSREVHGIAHNEDRGGTLAIPTLFTRVHEAGRPTGLYFGKSKLTLLAPDRTATVRRGPGPKNRDWAAGDDGVLAAAFARDFAEHRFALSLVHLRAPDSAGHEHGWMSTEYLGAVRRADEALGVVVTAIGGSAIAGQTTLIITSDHGGEARSHWKDSALSWVIPWVCSGPGVRAGRIAAPVTLLDTAPTALALLGLPPLPSASGRVVDACLPRS